MSRHMKKLPLIRHITDIRPVRILTAVILVFCLLFLFPEFNSTDCHAKKDLTKTTETLKKVNSFDYFTDSVTGISSKKWSKSTVKNNIANFSAQFSGPNGMPLEEYKAAMEQVWTDCTVYNREPEKIDFSLTKSYTYNDLIKFMKLLSRYEGVYLYDIGCTTSGRTMYALEIDIPTETTDSDFVKETVILTGSIHARETAGTTYILKELIDLVQANTDESRNVLSSIRFVAVPCVNPDGREGIAFDTKNYSYNSKTLWKATSNGTDLGRNFPGLSWGQTLKGNKTSIYISSSSSKLFYPGAYAGSCNETKAMIKFLYHYTVVEKAAIYIDYHQQGAVSYAGKPWDLSTHQSDCKELANALFSRMNIGNRIKYRWHAEETDYGLNGTGSTMSDYASSVAYGAKFSPGFGFCVYTDGINEYPLCAIPRMDKNRINLYKEPNPSFRSMTFEIGYGNEYLGYSEAARKLIAAEYTAYRFDRIPYYLYDYLSEMNYAPGFGPQKTVVRIMSVGDNLIHENIYKAALQQDGTYNFNPIYKVLKKYIKDADVKIVNQETILVNSPDKYSGYPSFGSPTAVGDALVRAGFNVITHATNHSYEKKVNGILNSVKFWKQYSDKVLMTGIYESEEDYRNISIGTYNGIKIAFLNYTYGLNGQTLPTDKQYLVKLLDKKIIISEIKRARLLADFVIVLPHWGTEMEFSPSDSQKKLAREMAEAGADCIIGTHPHVVEPLEYISTTDGRTVPCYYSLGNVISNMFRRAAQVGGLADITIEMQRGKVTVTSSSLEGIANHIGGDDDIFIAYPLSLYPAKLAGNRSAETTISSSGKEVIRILKDIFESAAGAE